MSSPGKLTVKQARKLVLQSQRLPARSREGDALSASRAALEHLGYVQIDTISVIQRAHHHTLWTRNPRYQIAHIDQLIAGGAAFEYWTHAAAYLPMRDYRFSLPRKHAIKSGVQEHWFERDEKMMRYVLDRIREEGPLMARDFENNGKKSGEWQSKPAKKALENLFMQGDLMISARQNFHKVYDLSERVLPGGIDDRLPDGNEHARFLIRRFLEVNGIAQAPDFSYLLKGVKPAIHRALNEMVEAEELLRIRVGTLDCFSLPESLALLSRPLPRKKVTILSPFDNLVIQRRRMRDLFAFDYQIECYVPAAKRQYGYFSLPLLWGDQFAGRMDCKAERKSSSLRIHSLHIEPSLKKGEEFRAALAPALDDFARFNECIEIDCGGMLEQG